MHRSTAFSCYEKRQNSPQNIIQILPFHGVPYQNKNYIYQTKHPKSNQQKLHRSTAFSVTKTTKTVLKLAPEIIIVLWRFI